MSLFRFLLFQFGLPFLSTLPVSAIEHTIQPGIDLSAFKDDSGLKAHIRKFIVQFLDQSGVD